MCRGEFRPGGAFIVGTNPATAIGPDDIAFEEYLRLLLNLDAFSNFYSALRASRQKPPESRTRAGLDGMAEWLGSLGWDFVADTNVSPYPTSSAKELAAIPPWVQSRWVFRELLSAARPALVVLHGKDSLEQFATIAPLTKPYATRMFSEVVQSPHLGPVLLPDGLAIEVYVCPHLKFFGKAGGKKFVSLQRSLAAAARRAV